MTISIILPDLRGGGAERVMLDIAHEFARLGHEVELVLMQGVGDYLPEAQKNFTIVDLAIPRARSIFSPLARYLRRRQPAVLIVAMWPLTAVVPIIARLSGYRGRILVTEHGILSKQYGDWGVLHNLILRLSTFVGYRFAHCRVGVSQGVCLDMSNVACLKRDRIVTIYNPIRRAISPKSVDVKVANSIWRGKGPRILTVGNLKLVKNHPLLLRAFAALPLHEAQLMLLGQGHNLAELQALSVELGVSDRVIFAGFHPDPSSFYATADLFVLSSDREGFGNVIVEALSFGLPVVSTDCPSGPAEILQKGQFGRLVPVGNASALALAMTEALEAPVDQNALICRAEEFAPEIAAQKYLELLGLT
ncbi:glycosyltransferase [Aliiroseovarius sp. S1123]|uniref:glycosyltransferase n=1 Tax=Aliiroseovarius sp. S1123 TaxID=2926404 RepID=UPI001FF47E77|nr:glycosyltransferase [Aliiroseovarius sp. S1123]MCK0171439.1 glycosyltransferase [Aliiroseovarius sp. S1123]